MKGFDELLKKGKNQGSLSTDEIYESLKNEKVNPMMIQEFIEKIQRQGISFHQSNQSMLINELMKKGHSQGYLEKQEIVNTLPNELDKEQISDLIQMIKDMGININE